MLNQKTLKEAVIYDPMTGKFVWRMDRRSGMGAGRVNAKAGTTAGGLRNGYLYIQINGKAYRAHRLAWLYVYGCWPSQQIDHLNRVKTDNRIANLRDATASENQLNKGITKRNTTGIKNISRRARSGTYIVNKTRNGVTFFKECRTLEMACKALEAAE